MDSWESFLGGQQVAGWRNQRGKSELAMRVGERAAAIEGRGEWGEKCGVLGGGESRGGG